MSDKSRVEGEAAPAPQAATPDRVTDLLHAANCCVPSCGRCNRISIHESNRIITGQAEAPRPSSPNFETVKWHLDRVAESRPSADTTESRLKEAVIRNTKYLLRAKLSESRNAELSTALETICLNHNLGKNWRFPDGCVCAGCSLLRRIDHAAEVTK
jgi:hypothetical protein